MTRMTNDRRTRTHTLGWSWLAASVMVAGTMLVACGEGGESTLPAGPSLVTETIAHAAYDDTGTLGNAPGGLPPGMTFQQLEQQGSARNRIRNDHNGQPAGRLRDLQITQHFTDESLMSAHAKPPDRTVYVMQVEWDHISNGCETMSCTRKETGAGVRLTLNLPKSDLRNNNWYWVYARICVDTDFTESCDAGHTWGPWAFAVIQVSWEEAPAPGPVAVPDGFSVSRDSWSECDTECAQSVTVTARNSAGDSSFDYRWRTSTGGWTSENGAASFTETWTPGHYYVQARAIDGSRKSEWSNREHVRVRPDYRHGDVPGLVIVPRVAPLCNPDPPPGDRSSSDPDPNPNYDWDDCFLWNVSWKVPNSDGGWPIESYGYGDVVEDPVTYDGFPPARDCGNDSTWKRITVDNSVLQSNPQEGRTHGFNVRVGIPEGWSIGISAINGKGEGTCRVPAPDFP